MKISLRLTFLFLLASTLAAQEFQPIALPKPATDGGKSLMQCLKERHTSREFANKVLEPQVLSNLLWAAYGINREDGHRTAPSAMNRQETIIYVFLAEGVYRYDAATNTLAGVLAGDHRAATGSQEFVNDAPVNLVYVADAAKMGKMSGSDRTLYAAADVGFIAENVYLFCASEGLNCVVRGSVDREQLAQILKLAGPDEVILGQTIGYPPQ